MHVGLVWELLISSWFGLEHMLLRYWCVALTI